ncbi:hypothetical protein ACROYT_G035073 [Oculina patagonica]
MNNSATTTTKFSTHTDCGEFIAKRQNDNTSDATTSFQISPIMTVSYIMTKGNKPRAAVISLICDDSLPENETIFKYVGQLNDPINKYFMSLTSKCCCPGKCGLPPVPANSTAKAPTASKQSDDKALKTWEIIVIAVAGGVLLVLVIVALVCCCKKRAGYEAV